MIKLKKILEDSESQTVISNTDMSAVKSIVARVLLGMNFNQAAKITKNRIRKGLDDRRWSTIKHRAIRKLTKKHKLNLKDLGI